ncbi:HNH endonuclease [Streptomyces sp. NPDC001536]|uniref:HNH endonuclease n=1 Tax=Streptomyces sp. NPDC001536 TaxID=3364583 RepID=UPI0036922C05
MNSRELKVVNGCPKWCVEDHGDEPPEDWGHASEDWQVSLPDGTLMMEACLVLEPGAKFPQLAVSGPGFGVLADDVELLGADEARALEANLHRFTARIQQAQRILQGNRPPRKKPCRPGQNKRSGWHETRLYLAERDGRRCFYCRTQFDALRGVTIDHYIPKSMWACNLPANLVLACDGCNQAKADRLTWSMAALLLHWAEMQEAAGGNGAARSVA